MSASVRDNEPVSLAEQVFKLSAPRLRGAMSDAASVLDSLVAGHCADFLAGQLRLSEALVKLRDACSAQIESTEMLIDFVLEEVPQAKNERSC